MQNASVRVRFIEALVRFAPQVAALANPRFLVEIEVTVVRP
jgi:hypothetical protein